MNEHPDIAELSADSLAVAVSEHLQSCSVCSQIHADIKLLDGEFKDLKKKTEIPLLVDQKIYQEISERSKEIRKSLFRKNVFTSISAIAAVIILSFAVFTNVKSVDPVMADINKDGDVNVLDSLLLAQKIDKLSFDKASDLNGDGVLDSKDLKLVRSAVVNLDGRLP